MAPTHSAQLGFRGDALSPARLPHDDRGARDRVAFSTQHTRPLASLKASRCSSPAITLRFRWLTRSVATARGALGWSVNTFDTITPHRHGAVAAMAESRMQILVRSWRLSMRRPERALSWYIVQCDGIWTRTLSCLATPSATKTACEVRHRKGGGAAFRAVAHG